MRLFFLILTGLVTLLSGHADATFMLSSTRVIHTESMKESSVEVYNTGDEVILIQAWLDSDQGGAPPFALTPSLVKIKAQQSHVFRIFYQGSGLPKERESFYWVNILAVPVATEGNDSLRMALQQSIKLFYRPAGLPGDAPSAPASLALSLKEHELVAQNSTPYHVNISSFRQGDAQLDGDMIPPYGEIVISSAGISENGNIEVDIINDFGGMDTFTGVLINGVAHKLKLKK